MDRKQAILDAALETFGATGTTAIDDVKRRSGASVGSIYHHFGGKDGIAAALYVDILRGYQEGFLKVLQKAQTGEQGIKSLVRYHLRWVEKNPAEARFLLHSGAGAEAGDALKDLNREMFAEVTAWLDAQEDLDRFMTRDLFYMVVIGPAQEAARHWLAGRIKSLRNMEEQLAEAAWKATKR